MRPGDEVSVALLRACGIPDPEQTSGVVYVHRVGQPALIRVTRWVKDPDSGQLERITRRFKVVEA